MDKKEKHRRNASDGRMYLYDIIDIKKKRATPSVYKTYRTKNPFLMY